MRRFYEFSVGRRPRGWARGLALLTVLAVLSSACGGDGTELPATVPGPVASGNVVLYTSMPLPIVERLQGVFEGAFPDIEGNLWISPGAAAAGGITLEVWRGRTADVQQKIDQELLGDGIQADVIWLAEPSPYEIYKAQGVFAPYSLPPGTPVPEEFVDPDGFYVAGRVINMVVAWNSEMYPEGIEDWPELLSSDRPVFPGPQSGAARAAIKGLTAEHGDDFFDRLADAGGTGVPSNGQARDGLVLGTFGVAGVLDYMIRQAQAAGSPVDYAFPESGTIVIPSPLAIIAESSNLAAAKVFVDFVLSRQGQQIVVEVGSFYPARTDVDGPPGAPELDDIESIPIDWRELAAESEDINIKWVQLFGRTASQA